MDTYTRQELAAQLNDPECDHVGPYFKSADNEVEILALLADHGLAVDENGWAQRVAPPGWREVTTDQMDPDDVQVYVGAPGTIFRHLGRPELICTRCHATNVQLTHVCADIKTGARRWVRAGR